MSATFAVFYQYAPDAETRRAPYREAHLAWLREQADAGRMLFAAATRDPVVDTGILVFRADDAVQLRRLLLDDPYAQAPNLILSVTVRPIAIVVGDQPPAR